MAFRAVIAWVRGNAHICVYVHAKDSLRRHREYIFTPVKLMTFAFINKLARCDVGPP